MKNELKAQRDGTVARVAVAAGDQVKHGDVLVETRELECWKHGSAFSVDTGAPSCLPALRAVPTYDVVVRDGVVSTNTGDSADKSVTYGQLIGGKKFNVTLTGRNVDATTGKAPLKPVQAMKNVGKSPRRPARPAPPPARPRRRVHGSICSSASRAAATHPGRSAERRPGAGGAGGSPRRPGGAAPAPLFCGPAPTRR